jgi:hypothetical protein
MPSCGDQAAWGGRVRVRSAIVEGVLLIALVVLGEALLEPVHPTGIEGKELQVIGFQVRIGGELQKEGQPVVTSGFSGHVQAVEVVLVEGLKQQLLGQRVTWRRVVKPVG